MTLFYLLKSSPLQSVSATLACDRSRSLTSSMQLGSMQRGSATLEYILVSTFALIFSIAALGYIGKIASTKLEQLDPDGVEPFELNWDSE